MTDRFNHHSHCVYNLGYHIIWCPKYRRKLLQWGIDERLKILLVEKATKMGCRIEKMEAYVKESKGESTSIPDWAHRLMKDRYGMKLHG